MKNKQILFTGFKTAELIENEVPKLNEGELLVETTFSAISCGTERANLMGDISSIDAERGEGAVFPIARGYSSSGVIIAKGKDTDGFEIGDKVAMSESLHKKYNVIDKNRVVKTDGISMKEAAMIYIGTFPMAAIRKTKIEAGESCMVMGLGILGLMAVQLARASGAVPVIAVDPIEERRNMALEFGADIALDPFDSDFVSKARSASGGGVNAAIEVTGVGAGLNECLDCMARFGRVALLGCTRSSDFTVDYYRKVHGPGISLIGAHTAARPKAESYPGYFTNSDDMKTVIKLISGGRIDFKKMIDVIYSPADCAKVYTELCDNKNFPPVALFDWSLV